MKKQNNIVLKYRPFISSVYYYSNQGNNEIIELQDAVIMLLDFFVHKNKVVKYFIIFGLDISAIYNFMKKEYLVNNIKGELNFDDMKIGGDLVNILENLDKIQDKPLFLLTFFIDSLFSKEVLDYFLIKNQAQLLGNVEIKKLIDDFYDNKEIKSIFEIFYKEIEEQDIPLFNIYPNRIKEDFKIDIDLDDEDSNNGELTIDLDDEDSNNEELTIDLDDLETNMTDDFSDFDLEDEKDSKEEKNTKKEQKTKEKSKMMLDTFGINLVDMAKKGKLEPMIGRKKELDQVIYTLLRKTKSNPLLIGEAGVGKTAIIEGLAQKIADGDVPNKLKKKKIYSLDMGTLVAGTKFRGEFEARLKSIIQESIDPENNIILFIDEIHTIIGAGNQEGGADTANMIKPYLARGELTIIGATTFDEYKKYIEKDPALTRRFQIVKVDEPSFDDAVKLLQGIKHRFEDFHGVNITDEAIKLAVKLSKRYILDKHLPDKAIDLIDEACSRKSTKVVSKTTLKEIDKLNKKIEKIEEKIKKAIEDQDYFKAADLKNEISEIKSEIKELENKNDIPVEDREKIIEEDIQNVISEKYGVSNSVLSKSEIDYLLSLKQTINKEIIGQEHAVEDVINALIRNKFSPMDRKGPIGSFLFLGASGVGKTYLAQLLAKHIFQDEKALIKINMSEYNQSMSASKLTGSAPGYVGYEEGGQLTESVRKKPYSVILFDEIEKGSPEVLNILLQILDQGYLEDNKGRKVDFKNTIIILTSNLGSELFNKSVTKVGFSTEKDNHEGLSEAKKELILQEVKNILPIELINRFDKIVYFKPINKQLLTDIFKKYYKDYKRLWKTKKGVNIPAITKDKIEKIVEKIHKEGAGVRGVEKYIYNDLETKIIEKMLKEKEES